jgi:hypothetical protein
VSSKNTHMEASRIMFDLLSQYRGPTKCSRKISNTLCDACLVTHSLKISQVTHCIPGARAMQALWYGFKVSGHLSHLISPVSQLSCAGHPHLPPSPAMLPTPHAALLPQPVGGCPGNRALQPWCLREPEVCPSLSCLLTMLGSKSSCLALCCCPGPQSSLQQHIADTCC